MNSFGHAEKGLFDKAPVSENGRKTVFVLSADESVENKALLSALFDEGFDVVSGASVADVASQGVDNPLLVLVFAEGYPTEVLIQQIRNSLAHTKSLPVVPVVRYEEQDKAAALLEAGCVDYLLWPFSKNQLQALLRRIEQVNTTEDEYVTRSPAGRRLLAMAQRVALTRAPVLITGETGTGKELIARYIHQFSGKGDAPFVAVNCAAIPASMLESILFGHERGAFTGATSAQPGKFELANGGTLLLDEVGELPAELQAKLLRVLQEQRVERLGGHRDIALDVRVIAATNRDLQREVAEGRFRSDLLFRLDVLPLHLAPLRERKEDVLPLAQRFIRRYAPFEGEQDLLTESACRALLQHDWPGNVRELENVVQRALVLRNGLYIQAADLGLPEAVQTTVQERELPESLEDGKAELRVRGKLAEYQHILDTIRKFDGHKAKAAASLGMSPRALRYRLKAMREQGIAVDI